MAKAKPKKRALGIGLRRILELAVLSVVIGGFALLAFNQFYVRPRTEALEARLDELTGSGANAVLPSVAAEADVDATMDPAPAGAASASAVELPPVEVVVSHPAAVDVRDTVTAWARAWSSRRVDDYLSYYSERFVPASGVTREVWQERRRQRLLGKNFIRVAVVAATVEEPAVEERRVSFTQAYRSDTFRDRVRKTLRLVWEDDQWKIVEETVQRQLPW